MVRCALRSLAVLDSCVFSDTATAESYTLSLHDALPISHAGGDLCRAQRPGGRHTALARACLAKDERGDRRALRDRKSTRLNSSHLGISYAVFCLKKKN